MLHFLSLFLDACDVLFCGATFGAVAAVTVAADAAKYQHFTPPGAVSK